MVDHDGQVFVFKVLVQQVAQLRLRPNQVDPHGQSTARQNRPLDLRLRSLIGTYGVERNVDQHGLPGKTSHKHRSSALQESPYLAASLVSSTARPLYVPHLAQAW